MAKGNLLLGMGRGKLGDVVLYRQNGQQMSRPRVRVVKNPRTSGQQIQRMIQATIAYAYAGLKTIVDHSFEGVQYGGKSMNYFMKRNMDALRAQVISGGAGNSYNARFAIPNVRILYPNEFIISNGSLPPCPDPVGCIVNLQTGSGLRFPAMTVNESSKTLRSLMMSFGASAGDQLTFLEFNVAHDGSDVVASLEGEDGRAVALAVRRIKFLESYTDEVLNTALSNLNYADIFDMSVTSEDIDPAAPAEDYWDVYVPSFFDAHRDVIGGCVILSRKSGDSWLRSPQKAWFNPQVFDGTLHFGFSLPIAYNAWMQGTTPVGVSEYILNGKPNSDVWPEVDDENP